MLSNLEKALNKEAKNVVTQARANLTRKDKNVTSELYKSLDYKIDTNNDKAVIEFLMAEHGEYQDKGVSGILKKFQTPYSFKPNKFPNMKRIEQWVKARGLKFRDSKGKFKKGGIKTLTYLIARSIHRKGIKPSLFFTKPYERLMVKLDDVILDALILDIEQGIIKE
jgi:hypothetical protein